MKAGRLGELALVFGKLGISAFGGPAAHIAMMEDEVVRRREWMTRDDFLDLLGATNLIPGPNSTEMAIHVGQSRAGWQGLIVAGVAFIVPAVLLVVAIATAYVRYGTLPEVGHVLRGIQPVIVAVVVQAIWGLSKTAVKSRSLAAIGVAAFAATLVGANELAVLGCAGLVAALVRCARSAPMTSFALPVLWAPSATGVKLWPLFCVFLKIGSVLFGSGYVLIAFIRGDFVQHLHWLTESQLLDAVTVGQVTPGPVFTTATFIGYVLGGPSGAAVSTIGIFLPAFVFVGLSGLLLPLIRRSPTTRSILDGVNVASLALMAVVAIELGHTAITDVPTAGLAVVSAVLLVRYKVNSVWLVLGGGLFGWLSSFS